ncbi:MAG: hypothetical protein NTV70_06500 [Acidobacteria bacterium]|nr:hypothetical protein [Acidobacteriota bacterium]
MSGVPVGAQSIPGVRVTSEYTTGTNGREVLSPALPRQAWAVFHLIVSGPPGRPFQLHIGQNPEEFAKAELWRDNEQLPLPFDSIIAPSGEDAIFRFRLFIDRDADVRRVKIEPQLHMDPAGWIIYPMEIRVVETTVPAGLKGEVFGSPAPALKAYWCTSNTSAGATGAGAKRPGATAPAPGSTAARPTLPANAPLTLAQDFALAARRPASEVQTAFERALGRPVSSWCQDGVTPEHPDWLLRFRDWLLR